MSENTRSLIFIGLWISAWIIFFTSPFVSFLWISVFLLLNLILWAVLEQSYLIAKSIKLLIKIILYKNTH
jgi:hypothetical protein